MDEINDFLRFGFYSDPGAWDCYRFPLIEPYELIAIDNPNVWHCGTRDGNSTQCLVTARLSVEYAGITDSIIYLNYTEELRPLEELPRHRYGDREMRRFVIIDVQTDYVEWHETREEWLAALNNRGIVNPQVYPVDSLYDDFANNRHLLFYPPQKTIALQSHD